MTKKIKRTLASLLLSLQLFFSLFAPFSPYLLSPQVFALSDLETTQKQSLFSFSYLDEKYGQLIVRVSDFYEANLPYSMYYLNQGRTQAVVGNLTTGMENAIFVGTQSGDHFLSHQWSRMIFKVKMADGFWSYRLEKDVQNKITSSISKSETDALSEAELSWLTWSVDEKNQKAETIQDVISNQDYRFPLDPKVSVKFTKLPEKTSPLSIQRLSLSKELADKYGADVAYQIETQMEDGSYELDLQLPVSENLSNTAPLEVISADNLDQLSQKDPDQLATIETDDPSVKVDNEANTIQVASLDHLSVWVVSQKVSVCHATGSQTNPYVYQRVSVNSIINGSGYQQGPIWDKDISDWGDIIPPFKYVEKGKQSEFAGYNWTEGQAILAKNCDVDGGSGPSWSCGDGVLDVTEECDYGSLNGSSTCTTACQWTAAQCSSQIIVNHDFSIPSVTNSSGWDIFGSSAVPGWTADWVGGSDTYNSLSRPEPKIEILAGANGWGSASEHLVELDTDWVGPSGTVQGEPASISLYQDVPTIVGNHYSLKFIYSARPSHENNQLKVTLNDDEMFNSGNIEGGGSLNWQTTEYSFIADSELTEIRFTETGKPDSMGMILKEVELSCEPVVDVTVCKTNSLDEPISSWPIVLRHNLPLEQVTVYPNGGIYSSQTFDNGDYLLLASGTYLYRGGTNLLSDPGYSERLESDGFTGPYFPWINVMNLNLVGALGIKINGQPTNWGEFNLEHRYAQAFSGYRGKFNFSVYDNQYADNQGSMRVDIYKGWLGQTQADGCYTFENVVVGDYTIEEMTRFGWKPLKPDSGSIPTRISETNHQFSFVNQSIGSISGYKYHDFNANKIWDQGDERETGLAGWTIQLFGQGDISKPLQSTQTAADGNYLFKDVTEGDYRVCEVPQVGWYNVSPGLSQQWCQNVRVHNAQTSADVNFGNKKIPVYTGAFSCEEGAIPTELQTLSLDSRSSTFAQFEFEASKQYLLEASGVYQYSSNSSHQADAAYGTLDKFSTTRNDIGLWGTSRGVTNIIGDLGEGMGVIVWDNDALVNENHLYRFLFEPATSISASFVISDWYDEWYNANLGCNNQGCMSDNSGSLELTIYECVSPQITPTPTPTDEVTPTPTPTGEMTPTPTPTGELTPTPTPTDEMTPTPTPTEEVTPTPTPTPTSEITPTPTPTGEMTPTLTPTPTDEVTPTPTPTASVTPSLTPTPTISSTDGGGGGQTGTTTGTVAGVSTTTASPWVCLDAKPGSITNFRVTSVGLNTVSLAWNSASLANDYGLFFTNLSTGTTYGASSLGNTTSYVVNGVTTGSYQFEVFPIHGCMPGDRTSLTQLIEGAVLVTRPVGPAGKVLGKETNVEEELVQEIMGETETSGEVAGASTGCISSRLYLPWILLIAQLGLMLAVEILMKKGKSFHKLIMIGVITALSIILFYLLRDCHCYEVKSFLSWLCVWYWLISVLETLLTRLFAYGFIEVVDKD